MAHLYITVGEPPEEGILDIIKHIRPAWDTDKLIIKELTGGSLNRLHYCGMADDKEESDVVVVKVYGGNTGFLDRDREVVNMGVAHTVGLAAPLYCRFKNGISYKYYRGNIVTSGTVDEDAFTRRLARKLAALHLVDHDKALADAGHTAEIYKNTMLDNSTEIIESLMSAIKDSYDDPIKENIRVTEFQSKADAMAELDLYQTERKNMNLSTCFCHVDANPSNCIYDSETGEIQLIDWEMCGMDYAAHEIGWYFAARTMVEDCADGALKFYPEKDKQLEWIRHYLEYRAELCGQGCDKVTEDEVNNMYKGSIICALIRIIGAVAYFLMEDQLSPIDKGSFRKARHFQKLFEIIKCGQTEQ